MLRNLRIVILSFVLANVAFGAWLARARATDWDEPLDVIMYVINGDGSSASQDYIDDITARSTDRDEIAAFFADIETFFQREAKRHGLSIAQPVDMAFAGELKSKPPTPPRSGSALSVMAWSLKLRYWAWRNDNYRFPQNVEIFVLYFDPEQTPTVAHSLGLQKGLIGVVNAFASKRMRRENHVVIAHELLHTLGATDKYDPATNLPVYPEGYADPHREPRYPQDKAEIMAGRIATAEFTIEAPQRLEDVVIGVATSREIAWTSPN